MDFTATPPPLPSPAASPERPIKRWRWVVHLLLIGSYPLVIGLMVAILGKGETAALSGSAKGLLVTCGVELLVFGSLFFLGWLASRASRDDLLLHWRPGWWVVPLGIGYSLA